MADAICTAGTSRSPTTWLGLPTVYYRAKDLVWSTNVWDLFDPANAEFDPEGLESYLRFGYSVFGRTPLRDIRFCEANQWIETADDGTRRLVTGDDPAAAWVGHVGQPERAIELVGERVTAWEASTAGPIVLPLSGGYDSRFLVSFIRDRARLRTFTYGLSNEQAASFEVRYAAELARRIGVAWAQIPLGHFHHLLDDWYALQGPTVHAHGMYQMEFFRQVRRLVGGNRPLLSGLIGDAWVKLEIEAVGSPEGLTNLGYTHGLHGDPESLQIRPRLMLESAYFETHRAWLNEPMARVVEAMRLKLILLSYLLRVPNHYGFQPWTPFLDLDIALEMLTITEKERQNRIWQQNYFRQKNLMVEDVSPHVDHSNTLNAQACNLFAPPPLNQRLFATLVKPQYVHWINEQVAAYANWRRYVYRPLSWRVRGLRRFQRLTGISDNRLRAYCAYLTLYPINAILQARELGQRPRP